MTYAYFNRNRYYDLLLASVALFMFGTSMLLLALEILAQLSVVLLRASTVLFVIAVAFLILRIGRGIIEGFRRFFRRS